MSALLDTVTELRDRESPSPNAGGVYQAGFAISRLWEAVEAIAEALDELVAGAGTVGVES